MPVSGEPLNSKTDWIAGVTMAALLVAAFGFGALDVQKNWKDLRPLVPGDLAPNFKLPLLNTDGEVQLSQWKGQVVLLDFWATWCPPCVKGLPHLQALHKEFAPRGLNVVGINREPGNLATVREFVSKNNLEFTVAVDTQDVGEQFRLVSLPLTVLVNRDGSIRRIFMGFTDPAVMRQAVVSALAGST